MISVRVIAVPFLLFATIPAVRPADAQTGKWSASGTLLEACTCAVPCTCNFGQGPSPHSYCHPVFAYKLDKADWNGIDLSGLIVAGADGPTGVSGFLDSRATAAQKPALEAMARAIFAQGGPNPGDRKFTSLVLIHEVKGNALRLNIEGRGGFDAKVLIGRDGTAPIVVENNTIWPIFRTVKAKTSTLTFNDAVVGTIKETNTNANYGAFQFGSTPTPTRTAGAKKTARSCCETPKTPSPKH